MTSTPADAGSAQVRVRIAPSPTGPLHIGAQMDPNFKYYLDGKVDEAAIYSRSLSAAEIQDMSFRLCCSTIHQCD